MNKLRTTLLWIACLVLFLLIFMLIREPQLVRMGFGEFQSELMAGDLIQDVRIDGNEIVVKRWDGYAYTTLGVIDDEMTQAISNQGIVIQWGEAPQPIRKLLVIVLPLLLVIVLFVYFVKKAQGSNTNILSMRKSTARRVEGEAQASFDDVGGCEEAKEQLRDVIDFLKHPDRWTGAGVRLPRGVLLEGPPGCGKTLLARAVAGESDASFYLVSASEFVEMFVGVGAARVRDTFDTARKNTPAVIFIDEIDAVGRRRGSGIGTSHDEREQTLNQLLVCMDGFVANEGLVVMAATNRSDVLDPALLRPGRFDRRIDIPLLARDQRREVLKIHTRKLPLAEDVDLDALADSTAGSSGSEIESLVNEAGLLAVRRVRKEEETQVSVSQADFEAAGLAGASEGRRFDCVDALMVESTTQLAHPTGKARVRLTLVEGTMIEGEIVWADAVVFKIRGDGDGEGVLVPKHQIKTIEALDGTEYARDVSPDAWSGVRPDCA